MRRLETSKMLEHSDRSNKGFSLIELLIVVAMILTIAGIAIPNLIRAKMSANEASAVASLEPFLDCCRFRADHQPYETFGDRSFDSAS